MARGVAVARRHRDKLSARDQLLLDVVAGPGGPRTCREEMAIQEAAVERAPDVAEFWYELGDNMLHCGDAMGMDGLARSLPAFERALAIDSGFTPAWEHVPGVLLWLGDSARARQAFAQYVRGQPEFAVAWQFAMFADSTEREQLIPDVAASRPFYIAAYGGVLGTLYEPRQVRFSERVLEQVRRHTATESDRQELLRVERILALNRGQPVRAARVGRQHAAYPVAERILDAVFHEGDSTVAAEAMVRARRAMTSPPARERAQWINMVFAAGLHDGARRNAAGTAAAASALRALPVPAESAWVRDNARRYAMVLDAQHAVVTNAPDARRVVAAADSMLREGPPGVQLRAAGNLAMAHLWERIGDAASAYAASKRVYIEPSFTPFWSTYKRERARLAALNGNVEDAIKHYREYLAMRYEPEPSLRAHIASVQGELARLERQSAGR
jgi:serine/threonine-protein kinase